MPLVSAAYIGLLILTAAAPVFLFFDGLIFVGVIQLYAAVGMTLIAIGIRPGEAGHVFKLVRIPAALVAVPLLWMLLQLLPVGAVGLSRSIWASAASALETQQPFASTTVDPGLTLIAVSRFATMAAVAFIATVVSIDRQRAEKLLLLLIAVVGVISVSLLGSEVCGLDFKNGFGLDDAYATMVTASTIGIILFAATLIMVVERSERRHGPRKSLLRIFLPIGITIAGLLICCATLIAGETGHAIFAAACGLAIIAVIYAARRMGFGPKAGLAMGCVAVVAAAMVIWTTGDRAIGDLSLRYASAASGEAVSLDKRMVEAVGLTGSGAGTFPAVSPIYGAQGALAPRPATFAAKIAIELGRPALWISVGLTCVLIVMFARGAFNRGRDCFYPLAGAGVTVAMVLDCFTNATLTNAAVFILVALTLGLGLGQSVGRNL